MNVTEAVRGNMCDMPGNSRAANAALFSQLVQEKKEEFIVKLQNGTTEPSYQIGAGSYTEKEWDKILKDFDAAEDALREAAESDEEKSKKTSEKEKAEDGKAADNETPEDVLADMLTAESTSCTYPASKPDEEDTQYITYYRADGILCRKKGQSGIEWEIKLEDRSQYESVMEFLNSLTAKENLRFACHENFWQDFLAGEIDIEDFKSFLDSKVVNGVPYYLIETENGAYIDKNAAKYGKYMNEPGLFKPLG